MIEICSITIGNAPTLFWRFVNTWLVVVGHTILGSGMGHAQDVLPFPEFVRVELVDGAKKIASSRADPNSLYVLDGTGERVFQFVIEGVGSEPRIHEITDEMGLKFQIQDILPTDMGLAFFSNEIEGSIAVGTVSFDEGRAPEPELASVISSVPSETKFSIAGNVWVSVWGDYTSEIYTANLETGGAWRSILKEGLPAQVTTDRNGNTSFVSLASDRLILAATVGSEIYFGITWRPPRLVRIKPSFSKEPLHYELRSVGDDTEVFVSDIDTGLVHILRHGPGSKGEFVDLAFFDAEYPASDDRSEKRFEISLASGSPNFLLWSEHSKEYAFMSFKDGMVRSVRPPALPFQPVEASVSADGNALYFLSPDRNTLLVLFEISDFIGIGDPEIIEAQEFLVRNGYGDGVVVDGIQGLWTQEATRRFQREVGLLPDGIIGPKTLAKMRGQ